MVQQREHKFFDMLPEGELDIRPECSSWYFELPARQALGMFEVSKSQLLLEEVGDLSQCPQKLN